MSHDHCKECGARIAGGQEACQSMFQLFGTEAVAEPQLGAIHRLVVDTYCMQHVDPYAVSAKSYAAHLVGLCCGIEHKASPALYDIIHRWLNGSPGLTKPNVLTCRGHITLPEVLAIETIEAKVMGIHDWAASVWDAYSSQHDIAHAWVKLAFEWKETNRRKMH